MAPPQILDLKLPKPVLKYFNQFLNKIPPQTVYPLHSSSDHIPSSAERASSKAIISASASSILTLEAELAKLQIITKAFESRLENIRAYNEYHRSVASPIHQLPDELLSEIFYFACDEEIFVCSGFDEVWRMQRVCVRWRRLIQGSPLLWSRFVLNGFFFGMSNPASIAKRIQSCLRFSGTAPLQVTFKSGSSFPALPVSVYEGMAHHAARWKVLHIDHDCFYAGLGATNTMMLIQHYGLGQLRKLEVTNFQSVFPSYMFHSAVALEDVCIHSSILPASPFPWSNVKKLTINRVDCRARDIYSVFLSMSVSLEELVWKNGLYPPNFMPEKIIHFPNLRILSLGDAKKFMPFVLMFRTPSLTMLHLSGHVGDVGPLLSMVQASKGCSIKHMSIADTYFNSKNPSILKLLKGLPTIEELCLEDWRMNDGVFRGLVWEKYNLLPLLRKLELLTDVTLDGDMINYITEIMSSRSLTPTELVQRRDFSPSPLSHLRCTSRVFEADYDNYKEDFDDLTRLGRERNVQVEIEIDLDWYKSESSSSESQTS